MGRTKQLAPTKRQLEVLRPLCFGASTAEIAESLGISRKTVDSHIDHLRRKSKQDNRVKLVLWAFASGYVKMRNCAWDA